MKKQWVNPTGSSIPTNQVTRIEKKKERYADKILKLALRASSQLSALKKIVEELSLEIFIAVMSDRNVDISKRKGNYTWFNYERTIKIEISMPHKMTFDDMLITSCISKLDEYLNLRVSDLNLESSDEYILLKELILGAFKTTHGRLDPVRVMDILKWRNRIKHELFQSALDDLEESIVRVFIKKYSRISTRLDDGSYEAIPLNYSDVK